MTRQRAHGFHHATIVLLWSASADPAEIKVAVVMMKVKIIFTVFPFTAYFRIKKLYYEKSEHYADADMQSECKINQYIWNIVYFKLKICM